MTEKYTNHLLNKRVNVQGHIVTVVGFEYNGLIAIVEGDWPGNKILSRVVSQLPEVIARDSFNYKPGDRG